VLTATKAILDAMQRHMECKLDTDENKSSAILNISIQVYSDKAIAEIATKSSMMCIANINDVMMI